MVAQTVKNLPAIRETQVQSLGWEDFGFYVSYSKLAICFTFGNLYIGNLYVLVLFSRINPLSPSPKLCPKICLLCLSPLLPCK